MDKPKHNPQPYTQKLLDLGVIEFSETLPDCDYEPGDGEIYTVSPDYIIGVNSVCLNCGIPTVCTYLEIYDIDDNFVNIICSFCEEIDDDEVIPNDLKIFKLMEVE